MDYITFEHLLQVIRALYQKLERIEMLLATQAIPFDQEQSALLTVSSIDLQNQLQILQAQIEKHENQLCDIYHVVKSLVEEKAAQDRWDDRDRIGFKK